MKLLMALLWLCVFVSCGTSKSTSDFVRTHQDEEKLRGLKNCEECRSIANKFDEFYQSNSKTFRIVFDDLEEGKAGVCVAYLDGEPIYIAVDENSWKGYTPLQKEVLMYHELGHCVLGHEHLDEEEFITSDSYQFQVKMKKSLMHSSIFNVLQSSLYSYYQKDFKEALRTNVAVDFNSTFPLDDINTIHLQDIESFNKETDYENVILNKRLYTYEICSDDNQRIVNKETLASGFNRCQ